MMRLFILLSAAFASVPAEATDQVLIQEALACKAALDIGWADYEREKRDRASPKEARISFGKPYAFLAGPTPGKLTVLTSRDNFPVYLEGEEAPDPEQYKALCAKPETAVSKLFDVYSGSTSFEVDEGAGAKSYYSYNPYFTESGKLNRYGKSFLERQGCTLAADAFDAADERPAVEAVQAKDARRRKIKVARKDFGATPTEDPFTPYPIKSLNESILKLVEAKTGDLEAYSLSSGVPQGQSLAAATRAQVEACKKKLQSPKWRNSAFTKRLDDLSRRLGVVADLRTPGGNGGRGSSDGTSGSGN